MPAQNVFLVGEGELPHWKSVTPGYQLAEELLDFH